MKFKTMITSILIVSAIQVVYAIYPNEKDSPNGSSEGLRGEWGQLRFEEAIETNSNDTLMTNKRHEHSHWASVGDTRYQLGILAATPIDQIISNETYPNSSGEETLFPFDAHESLNGVAEGRADGDGLPPGMFYMQNATCNENEDPNCIIDHNTTCVGDPLHCHLTYDEYMEMLDEYIYPSVPVWILICSHAVVFLMGLVSE